MVDGINVINATILGSYTEFIEKVLPILREHGLAKPLDTTAQTFRNRLFGSNHLSERHPAAQYRGAFSSKEKVY